MAMVILAIIVQIRAMSNLLPLFVSLWNITLNKSTLLISIMFDCYSIGSSSI